MSVSRHWPHRTPIGGHRSHGTPIGRHRSHGTLIGRHWAHGRLLALVIVALAAANATADDFTDTIDRANKAYQAGDMSKSREELAIATTLLHQERAKAFEALLPTAPSGWRRTDSSASSAPAAIFGGGTMVAAAYRRGASDTVEVAVTADAPMVSAMSALLRLGGVGLADVKVVRLGSETALYQPSDDTLTTVINDRILVKVQGSDGLPLKDLRAFLEATDFARMKKL